MSDVLGSLCIVLHGHLPYVLHHGSYPHGEAWLYEAAAETYLPLLDMIGEVALHKARPAMTIGLTPVLLEQLAHERFKSGFVTYLNERVERAGRDRKEFEQRNDLHMAFLAERWAKWYTQRIEQFERIGRDIPREFATRFREGHIQILTSNATHAYMPLLLNDQMLTAQMAAGTSTSERILGVKPRGMWLPECAYRPSWDHWLPAVLYDNPRSRPGIELFIANAGVTHFFVDTHLITGGEPKGTFENGNFRQTNDTQLHWDQKRGWRHPLEPVGVVSHPEPPRTFAFCRHPKVSEQVWSGTIGYPGAGQYLEFHRKHGERGLRYHKITDNKAPLSSKDPYYPDDIHAKLYENSQHFANVVKHALGEYKHFTGRQGVCVASFDAELFGHWWFEGVNFLRDVVFTLSRDPQVKLMTAEEALYHHPPDKVVRMPEGSWGEKGNHSVWINDRTRWIWEIEYRAEGRMLKLLHELPWKTNPPIKAILERAARELLLLQASDWPFVIHSQGAVDYGIQRFSGHATRFDRMTLIAEKLAAGGSIDPIEQTQIDELDAHDSVFKNVDFELVDVTDARLTSPVIVRRATPADAEAITPVHVASIRTLCAKDYTPEQIDAWAGWKSPDKYRAAMDAGEVFFVAEVDGRVVGFSVLHGDEVKAVYLHPDQVGRGIGRRLLGAVESEARARGVVALHLTSTLTSVVFYEACGYRNDGPTTHPMPASGVALECVKFSKRLG